MAKAEAARLHAAMMEIINSKLLSRCVCLAAELAIADHLRNGAEDIASLASKTGTNVDALYHVMRLLAASGIFIERPSDDSKIIRCQRFCAATPPVRCGTTPAGSAVTFTGRW